MNTAFIEGFLITFGSITSIGLQNMHVLRMGIYGKYVWSTVGVCIGVDIVIPAIGIFGLSSFIERNPDLLPFFLIAGALFMTFLAISSLIKIYKSSTKKIEINSNKIRSLKQALLIIISISLLNVQMYMESFLLIGSLGSRYTTFLSQTIFLTGSVIASTIWYVSLGFFSQKLSSLLKSQLALQILEGLTAIVMFALALIMIKPLLNF